VVVNYTRCSQEAEQVVQQIKAEGSEAIAIEADVSEEDQVQAMFHTIREFIRRGVVPELSCSAGKIRNSRSSLD
jgi:glucose 1-dehydrogenase